MSEDSAHAVTASETIPAPPSAPAEGSQRRRLSSRVREAREKLTSTGSGSRTFDIELMREFAESRVSSIPLMLAIAIVISGGAALWAPHERVLGWLGFVIVQLLFASRFYQRMLTEIAGEFDPKLWHKRTVVLEAIQGVSWALMVLLLIDNASETPRSLMFFALLGLRPSLTHLIGGHLVVIAPFVFRTTLATVTQLEPALLESSASLGAGRFMTFRRITLPLIAPGIFAGAFLAFVASMDNVPVSLFLSSARTDMLPIRMWGMMESTLDPRIAAVSGVLIAAAFLLMLVMEWTVGLTRRMRD